MLKDRRPSRRRSTQGSQGWTKTRSGGLTDSLAGAEVPLWPFVAAVVVVIVFLGWLLLGDDSPQSGAPAAGTPAERVERPAGPVKGRGLERSVVYHSPQTPGYTAWTGLWIMPDGDLMTAFSQVTGPIPSPPDREWAKYDLTSIYLSSSNDGRTWREFRADSVAGPPQAFSGQASIGLSDGALLRRVNGEDLVGFDDGPRTAYIQRLEPGADEWGEPVILLDPDRFTYNVSRIQELSDGRLIATGNFWEVPAGERGADEDIPLEDQGWLLHVSDDGGRTWRDALTIPRRNLVRPNEWDVAELPDGDLLAVMRTRVPPNSVDQVRRQARLEREGDGWVMGAPQETPFPHSGHPELLATQEGVVLHIATSGTHYTPDGGENWERLSFPSNKPYRSNYYPVSVQDESGEIYVVSHSGGDDDYGERDQSVVLDRFRLVPDP